MSPTVVTPKRRDCWTPIPIALMTARSISSGGIRVRRSIPTSHAANPPTGGGPQWQSLSSRCVWAFTSPGRTTASPRSRISASAWRERNSPREPRSSISPSLTRMAPSAMIGPTIGATHAAHRSSRLVFLEFISQHLRYLAAACQPFDRNRPHRFEMKSILDAGFPISVFLPFFRGHGQIAHPFPLQHSCTVWRISPITPKSSRFNASAISLASSMTGDRCGTSWSKRVVRSRSFSSTSGPMRLTRSSAACSHRSRRLVREAGRRSPPSPAAWEAEGSNTPIPGHRRLFPAKSDS